MDNAQLTSESQTYKLTEAQLRELVPVGGDWRLTWAKAVPDDQGRGWLDVRFERVPADIRKPGTIVASAGWA